MGKYEAYLNAARDVVREAGELLRKNVRETGEIFFKGVVNLVTKSDTESQDLIFSRLSARFPDHDFLAEEGLRALRGAEFRWVFDPLDGTTNFAHKFPVFCVSLGLEHQGRLACGAVYDPMRDEMFWAEKGGGAYLNGERIRVSKIDDLNKSLLATGFSYDIRETKTNIGQFNRFLLRAQGVRRCGSAALDLCYVACGRLEGFWEMKLSPWDTAAGSVVVDEAGGRVSDFGGHPVNIYHPEVVASNGLVHQALMDVLNLP
jgi:myo-inositol-1(or 4)-monophosphatase